MKYRRLGRANLMLSEIGYGGWGIGGSQWRGGSDEESLRALHRAFELGVNFVDTALAYGDGHSERLIGRAVQDWEQPVVVATKIPPMNRVWPAPVKAPLDAVFPRNYIIESTEQSLRNLRLETLDLQQFHVWNPLWTAQEEWQRTVERLKQSGKVRFMGVSLTEHDADSGLDLVDSGVIDALQVVYNIFDPRANERLLPFAESRGVGILARVPLDEGGLSGAIRNDTTFQGEEFRAQYFGGDRKQQVIEHATAIINDTGGDPRRLPEIALRFCLGPPAVTSVIPGMRRVRHVESNVRAAEAGSLPDDILALLEKHRWIRNFYTQEQNEKEHHALTT